jgi:hypothetical protein
MNKINNLLIGAFFLFFLLNLESRPGMGGDYRSNSGYKNTTSYTSIDNKNNRSNIKSSSLSNSSQSNSNTTIKQEESSYTTVPDSSLLDLRLKILKNGNIEVKEEYLLDSTKVQKSIRRVTADVLKGIMSGSLESRQESILGQLGSEKNSLTYTIEKAFHMIYGHNTSYVFFEQPFNIKKYSILIELEEGITSPEINFWLSSDGGSNYLGTAPFSFYNSEQKLEIGKRYEFTSNEYKYSIYLYMQYPINSLSPTSYSIDKPSSYVSYKTKIEVGKTKYTTVQTQIDYKIEESLLDNLEYISFPKNISYNTVLSEMGIFSYFMDKTHEFEIYYSSFKGDWETSFFSEIKSLTIKEPQGVLNLSYDTYGNFKENENIIEFDIFIPFLPLKTYSTYLKSFEIDIVLPEGANETNTKIYLYSAHSTYMTDQDPAIMLLPISSDTKNSTFKFKSSDLFLGPSRLVVNMDIDKSIFTEVPGFDTFLLFYSGLKNPLSQNFYLWSLPCLFIILLPFSLIFILFRRKNRKDKSTIVSLQDLNKLDPEFNLENFQTIVGKIANVLQESWNSGDMKNVRPFISSGLYSRLNNQLNLLKNNDGVVNKMEEFGIVSISIKDYSTENEYQTVHLNMVFEAKDITVPADLSENEIQKKLKSSSLITYSEIYSFNRKIGVKTNPEKFLITGNCPSCGSPADYSHYSLKCNNCGNIYNSGEKDWVLSEITQISEWKKKSTLDVPSFNHQVLEDRASAVFWKYLTFLIYGNKLYIQRDATHKFIQNFVQKSEKIYLPVVGGVNLLDCIQKENRYEAKVQILWSASNIKGGEPSGKVSHILMVRDSKPNKTGFSETICVNCGAPFPERDTLVCEYCNESIPEKVNDWLLEEVK